MFSDFFYWFYFCFPRVFSYNAFCLTNFADNPLAVITREAANKAHIQYHPTAEQQQADNDKGLQGRFLVQYDVKRVRGGGEIQVCEIHTCT